MANRIVVVSSDYSSDTDGPFHEATSSDTPTNNAGQALATTIVGLTSLEISTAQRTFRSPAELYYGAGTQFTLISDTAYFVYLGRTVASITPKYVEFHVVAGGTGAQTAEVGFFSTPVAPNKASQVLTKLVSTGTIGDVTGTGVLRNTAAFSTAVVAQVHLWAGIRTAMATTQPALVACYGDWAQGLVLSTATAGALTAAGPWTGALGAGSLAADGPALRGTLD